MLMVNGMAVALTNDADIQFIDGGIFPILDTYTPSVDVDAQIAIAFIE